MLGDVIKRGQRLKNWSQDAGKVVKVPYWPLTVENGYVCSWCDAPMDDKLQHTRFLLWFLFVFLILSAPSLIL